MAEALSEVTALLHSALLGDAEAQRSANAALTALTAARGFAVTLCRVVLSRGLPQHVRHLAAILLKGCVEQRWRPGAQSQLSDEDKAMMRDGALYFLDEADDQIALVLAITVGKMARYDFPQKWPAAIAQFRAAIADTSTRSLRAMQIVAEIVQALCSRRLREAIDQLHVLAPELFAQLRPLWHVAAVSSAGAGAAGSQYATETLFFETLCRALALIVEYALPSLGDEPRRWIETLPQFVTQSAAARPDTSPHLCKGVQKLQNVFICVIERHAESGAPLLAGLMPFACEVVSKLDAQHFLQKRTLKFLRSAVINSADVGAGDAAASTSPQAAQQSLGGQLLFSFFGEPRNLQHLLHCLFSKHLPLQHADLTLWQNEPEAFSDDVERSVRAYAETVSLSLLEKFSPLASPIFQAALMQLWQQPLALETALIEDGLLKLCGLGVYVLSEVPNFAHTLVARCLAIVGEASSAQSLSWPLRILVRRAVWVLSCWRIQVTDEQRARVFHELRNLFRFVSGPDVRVAVAAAESLQSFVEDVSFGVQLLVPIVESVLSGLLQLLSCVRDIDLKSSVLQALTCVLHACSEHVKPYIASLLPHLEQLWHISASESIFRGLVMQTFSEIVEALDLDCDEFVDRVVVPCVGECLVPARDNECLHEDAVALWKVALSHVSSISSANVSVTRHLQMLLEKEMLTNNGELVALVAQSLGILTLVGKLEFVQAYGNVVLAFIQQVLSNVRPDCAAPAVKLATRLVSVIPQHLGASLEYAFALAVGSLATHGDPPSLQGAYVLLLCRGFVHDVPSLWSATQRQSLAQGSFCHALFAAAFAIFDRLSLPEERQLVAMTLLRLLHAEAGLIVRLPDAIGCVVSCLFDSSPVKGLPSAGIMRAELRGHLTFAQQDAVMSVDLKQFTKAFLQALAANPSTATYVAALDQGLLHQLETAEPYSL